MRARTVRRDESEERGLSWWRVDYPYRIMSYQHVNGMYVVNIMCGRI